MKSVSLLIKPAGALCNMRCRYCFYRDEEANRAAGPRELMTTETLEEVFRKTLPRAAGRCAVAYQGGEPTLAGLDWFRTAVELERKYASPACAVEHSIQTNGLCLDREWTDFFAREKMLVGISLDGPKELHDENRVDAAGKGTYARVMRAVNLLKSSGAEFNVLSVVTARTCRSAGSVYGFFERNALAWQQYVPCLPPLETEPFAAPWALKPKDYAAFLRTQFDCWYRDVSAGRFRYNRYFDNLVGILAGRQPEACDMRGVCSPQLVVEADGSVYPCDFYCLDGFRLGNFRTDTLDEIEARREALGFLAASTAREAECGKCEWRALCRGGCRRRRTNSARPDALPGKDLFCEAYREFFPYAYERLCRLAASVRRGG